MAAIPSTTHLFPRVSSRRRVKLLHYQTLYFSSNDRINSHHIRIPPWNRHLFLSTSQIALKKAGTNPPQKQAKSEKQEKKHTIPISNPNIILVATPPSLLCFVRVWPWRSNPARCGILSTALVLHFTMERTKQTAKMSTGRKAPWNGPSAKYARARAADHRQREMIMYELSNLFFCNKTFLNARRQRRVGLLSMVWWRYDEIRCFIKRVRLAFKHSSNRPCATCWTRGDIRGIGPKLVGGVWWWPTLVLEYES